MASRRKIAVPEKYKHINFKPPQSVANAAAKGLEYRGKASPSNRGGLTPAEAAKEGIGSGVQRAVNLKNRDNISPDVVRQMNRFFSRHQKNKSINPEHKGEPWNDKGYVSWLIWGGDPGWSWAKKIIKQMETADEKAKKKASTMNLRKKLIRLAHEKPELRSDLLPLLRKRAGWDRDAKILAEAFLQTPGPWNKGLEVNLTATTNWHKFQNLPGTLKDRFTKWVAYELQSGNLAREMAGDILRYTDTVRWRQSMGMPKPEDRVKLIALVSDTIYEIV